MKLSIASIIFCLFIVSSRSESFSGEITESAIIDTESNELKSEVRSGRIFIPNFVKKNKNKKSCSERKKKLSKKPIEKPMRRWDPHYDPNYESNYYLYHDAVPNHRTPRPSPRRSTTFYESSYFFYKHYVEGRNL